MDKKLFFIVFPVIFTANIYLLDFNTTVLAIPAMADEFDLSLKLASWIILSSFLTLQNIVEPVPDN